MYDDDRHHPNDHITKKDAGNAFYFVIDRKLHLCVSEILDA